MDDIIIPTIFHALFDVTAIQKTEDRDVVLLREPKDAAYYEFSAKDDLVITNKYPGFTPDEVLKSFHADTYCFDSLPEKECFFQYIKSDKVQEVYFTGMFTSNQGDLSVYYYDPESGRIRQYYPDFLAKMKDGTYQLIEVKGDNKIDDVVVQAKKEAALEIWQQTGGRIDYLVCAIGTSGTLMGLSRFLKVMKPDIRVVCAQPIRGHYIQGLKNMEEAIVPDIYDPSQIDMQEMVESEEAIAMAREIIAREAIFAGMSSGAAMLAAVRTAQRIERGNIVVVFPDRAEKYLSTTMFDEFAD